PRQLEVLELMAKGLQNKEIAGTLGIAPATAKRHVSMVIEALDVTNRTEAVSALHELGLGQGGDGSPEHRVSGFGGRPAIAVLPFDTFSDDPEQAALADGLVEDLTTRLATWRWFPVISRTSAFAYRGRSLDVKEVSQALGARYVVEGSVRRAGDRARITVQVIDGVNGEHVLADQYDRDLADVFAAGDEIVDGIVIQLEPALAKIEGVRVLTQHPTDLGVWQCLHRGFLHLTRFNAASVQEASAMFRQALERDPHLSHGHTGLAFSEVSALLLQIAEDRDETAARVLELSRRALACDPNDAVAHFTLGMGHLYAGDAAACLADNDRALELNPSVTWAHGGRGVALCAIPEPDPDAAAAALETAIRLSPVDPFLPYLLVALANARVLQGRLEDALACNQRSLALAPDLPIAYGSLVFCLWGLGRLDEARGALAELHRRHPGYSPVEQARAWTTPEGLGWLQAALRDAGGVEP
ncbi:MAG TPA: LuxR C-terminal-related transcriptional regulator, partial [Candidatus Limnocylindrales bacterium]|nr:LuxR C-terminal-related transcriptional regulator [Candidatus Limnocylindrales bacterium]